MSRKREGVASAGDSRDHAKQVIAIAQRLNLPSVLWRRDECEVVGSEMVVVEGVRSDDLEDRLKVPQGQC